MFEFFKREYISFFESDLLDDKLFDESEEFKSESEKILLLLLLGLKFDMFSEVFCFFMTNCLSI